MTNRFLIFTLLALSSLSAYAGGYRVALHGGRALAMGHAGVGVIDNAEGAFFNPSGLVYLKNRFEVSVGATPVISQIKYQNVDTGQYEKTNNPVTTPFYVYTNYQVTDWFSAGLSVYTPYGSTVKYDKDWVGSHLVNKIELSALYFQPHLAFKLSEHFSFAGGPLVAIGSVEFNRNLNRTLTDIDGNRSNVTVKESGITRLGWHASATFTPFEGFRLGASYRSEIIMDPSSGKATFSNVPNSPMTPFEDTTFSAEMPLPAELIVGFGYEFGDWTLAFDYNRAFWSAYKSLDIEFANPNIPNSVNPRNYKNASSYKFGAQYMLKEGIALRAGYYFDETPVQKGYFAPETPRGDSHNFTIGAGFDLGEHFRVDAAFMYIHFKEIDASYDWYAEGDGYAPFSGKYKTMGLVPSIGISYRL